MKVATKIAQELNEEEIAFSAIANLRGKYPKEEFNQFLLDTLKFSNPDQYEYTQPLKDLIVTISDEKENRTQINFLLLVLSIAVIALLATLAPITHVVTIAFIVVFGIISLYSIYDEYSYHKSQKSTHSPEKSISGMEERSRTSNQPVYRSSSASTPGTSPSLVQGNGPSAKSRVRKQTPSSKNTKKEAPRQQRGLGLGRNN
jgi:hypothetical protein